MDHRRRRVLGPTEAPPAEDFYAPKTGLNARQPDNHTAFRQAERRFKSKHYQSQKDDLPILDPQTVDERLIPCGCIDGHTMYEVQGIPGFKVIPGVISPSEQRFWLEQCFTQYMAPPNQTNLDDLYEMPPQSLWSNGGSIIKLGKRKALGEFAEFPNWENLFRRIRWTTLGYQYNWTTKEYDFEEAPVPFPSNLASWCAEFAQAAGFPNFKAEAGIVNYYQLGDTLTGHVDRSERNMEAPLLSMSLGLSCIFLLGGADRNDPVTPILVRSGDVTILSGPSRLFYHGVPLIIPNTLPAHLEGEDQVLQMIRDARINLNIRQVL